jgi:hypothetical protein
MLIKSPDDKKKRLSLLEELQKSERLDARQKQWLREEYWRLAPGVAGERDAAHYLDLSFSESKNHAVLHDLRLEADGQSAQIDHLVVDRTLEFYLLETKSYNGSLQITEHGEFEVEYADGRRYGIESPLEQSRRHETVLRKVLDRLEITGRAGTTPRFTHVVMLHPKAVIRRPPTKQFDTSMVIKADQFATWHKKHVDKQQLLSTLNGMLNVRGRNTVKEWGEKLKAEHRPTNPLALPEFMKPKAPEPSAPVRAAAPPKIHAAPPVEKVTPIAPSPEAACITCGKSLTPKVVKFCKDKAEWFGGKLYCYAHQDAAKKAAART